MIKMDNINSMMVSSLESTAQMSIGQAVLRLADKTLSIIEKSVQWSLPTQEIISEENGKSFCKVELVRPLPWILFLPSLIILRLFRIGLNTATGLLGYPRIEPSDMIRIIQKGRRRVRSIKTNGLKSMRQKKIPAVKDRVMTMKEASKSLAKSIRLTLSTLSCLDSGSKTSPSPPPTKIRVSNLLDTTLSVSKEKESIESSLSSPTPREIKRKFSEISSDNLSESEFDEEPLVSKIERLANETGSDKDFCPTECSTSDDNEFSESEADVSISLSEVQDLKAEKEEMDKIWCSNPECTNTLCDNEQHKVSESLIIEKPTAVPRASRPQRLNTLDWESRSEESATITEKHIFTSNGIINERDITYYSPISWKSVSPEVLFPSDKHENQIDVEGKTEELTNGEVNIEKESKYHDSNKLFFKNGAEEANGHLTENHKMTLQSGGNKHNQKNKRGNHSNRKKK